MKKSRISAYNIAEAQDNSNNRALESSDKSTLNIYMYSEKHFHKQPLKKYVTVEKEKKVVTNSGTFMGQSLLEVMNVIKVYFHIGKEFAQVLFTTSLFLYNVKEKSFKIMN